MVLEKIHVRAEKSKRTNNLKLKYYWKSDGDQFETRLLEEIIDAIKDN